MEGCIEAVLSAISRLLAPPKVASSMGGDSRSGESELVLSFKSVEGILEVELMDNWRRSWS